MSTCLCGINVSDRTGDIELRETDLKSPGAKVSKMSNSPQPDCQQEQGPYCLVRGIFAFRAQIAGMLTLNPSNPPSSGMLNSMKNALSAPLKPTVRTSMPPLQHRAHYHIRAPTAPGRTKPQSPPHSAAYSQYEAEKRAISCWEPSSPLKV